MPKKVLQWSVVIWKSFVCLWCHISPRSWTPFHELRPLSLEASLFHSSTQILPICVFSTWNFSDIIINPQSVQFYYKDKLPRINFKSKKCLIGFIDGQNASMYNYCALQKWSDEAVREETNNLKLWIKCPVECICFTCNPTF